MDFFNYDPREEMNEFMSSRNWVVPDEPVAPSPATGSTTAATDIQSPVSTDDYDISEMEAVAQRKGKGKKAATDDIGPKKYSPEETLFLAKVFIDVSEDPIIGNSQRLRVYWDRVTEKYNAGRPKGTVERQYEKLRKHWSRVQKDVLKFTGKWNNAIRMWPSGCSEMDLVAKANEAYYADEKKAFKYYEVWKLLQRSPKFSGGAEAASGAPKRTKVSGSGNYSTSDGGHTIDLNMPDEEPDLSFLGTQSRPMGTKAAKRKAKGKAATSQCSMPVPPPNPSLDKMSDSMTSMSLSLQISHLRELMAEDKSAMSEIELEMHNEMIDAIRSSIRKNK